MSAYTFDKYLFSDLHKDAYGRRPDWDYFLWLDGLTDDEMQAEWDRLVKLVEQSIEQEAAEQKECIAVFETLVALTIKQNVGFDRNKAITLIALAEDCDPRYGDEAIEFHYGLPFGYLKKVKAA